MWLLGSSVRADAHGALAPARGRRGRRRASTVLDEPAAVAAEVAGDADEQDALLRDGRRRATPSSPPGTGSRCRASAPGVPDTRRRRRRSSPCGSSTCADADTGPVSAPRRALPRGPLLRPRDHRGAPRPRARRARRDPAQPRRCGHEVDVAPVGAGGSRAASSWLASATRSPSGSTSSRDPCPFVVWAVVVLTLTLARARHRRRRRSPTGTHPVPPTGGPGRRGHLGPPRPDQPPQADHPSDALRRSPRRAGARARDPGPRRRRPARARRHPAGSRPPTSTAS